MTEAKLQINPYVFAGDEAGDTSFRFDRGASTHFTIALIGTRDADNLRLALDQVRMRFHLAPDFEFKLPPDCLQRVGVCYNRGAGSKTVVMSSVTGCYYLCLSCAKGER